MRYLIECGLQVVVQFYLEKPFFRIQGYRVRRGSGSRLEILLLQLLVTPRASCSRNTLVDHDSCQPSEKTGLSAELVEMHECSHVGRLHRVLHLGVVSEHSLQYRIQTMSVTEHENGIERSISSQNAFNDVIVGCRILILRRGVLH
ncbi:MAG TPA: hypothetical protein VKW78_05115 [Terriglobales bacterium]|nr:hypothetical protein [Terriglobales bacterium]